MASYWGQNSYGAVNTGNTANFQKTISFYCNDNAIDVFPIAFLNVFFGTGGVPSINLANTCNPTDNATFPGTELPNCSSLAPDIAACQAKGKIVTISLGGATGAVGFQSDDQATSFAQTIWDLFLGGTSQTRPFGNAVLDGIDLDIEGGGSDHYSVFVNKIRSLASGASKQYYVTAAPQCVFPDAALGGVLNAASFDAVYDFTTTIVAYNHLDKQRTGISESGLSLRYPNKNVKVYIGAPASSSAAGSGYVPIGTLGNIAVQMRQSFPSFGGVMLWDASQAYANGRYDLAIKNALSATGGTGFTFPACSAPAYVAGTNYAGGAEVSFGGYIWQAKWSASSQPSNDPSGEWSAISACGGSSIPPSSSTTTAKPTSSTTTKPTSTSSVPTTTSKSTSPTTTAKPTTSPSPGGQCAGIPAWSSTVPYVGGSQVTYSSHLWTAKWWSEADVPGGSAGDWTDNGPCGSSLQAAATSSAQDSAPSSDAEGLPIVKSRFFRI
uniref:chitinase n=1 Tax=Psilocybe cubensis TaxID=181762 RepID=A0A8H7Y639_PSICU